MARLLPAAAVAVALALSACERRPPRTQDRLTPERMQALVALPLRYAKAGAWLHAQSEFEALLARSGKGAESDLLTAFGISLYSMEADSEEAERRWRRAALPYLERAIPAAAARFGAGHPEVALALNTYGDALEQASPGDPPRQVDRAYAKAYLIRLRALGPRNGETVYALFRLAQVRGLRSRTRGDPRLVAEVGRMFEDSIRGIEASRDPELPDVRRVRLAQLEMYVRNGRPAQALAIARAEDSRPEPGMPECEIGSYQRAVAQFLVDAGRPEAAESVLRPSTPQLPECDLEAFLT